MMQVAIYVNDQLFGTYHAMRLTGMLPLNHSATKLRGLNTIRSVQCSTSGTYVAYVLCASSHAARSVPYRYHCDVASCPPRVGLLVCRSGVDAPHAQRHRLQR